MIGKLPWIHRKMRFHLLCFPWQSRRFFRGETYVSAMRNLRFAYGGYTKCPSFFLCASSCFRISSSGRYSRCFISFSYWLWLLQGLFAGYCWNFIFENLNSANPLINSDIWFYQLFYPSQKFRKCLFSAWNEILLRKNGRWSVKVVLIISDLPCIQNVFFRKSTFLFR